LNNVIRANFPANRRISRKQSIINEHSIRFEKELADLIFRSIKAGVSKEFIEITLLSAKIIDKN